MPRSDLHLAIPLLVALAAGCGPPGALPTPTTSPGPSPGATASPDRLAACAPRFTRFDDDHDGRWRAAEVARWLHAFPAVPSYGPCPRPGPSPADGRAVAQAAVGTGTAEPMCPIAADPGVFAARLDRDGDGGLSAGEACVAIGEQLACEARFALADADRDGKVVLPELVAATPPRPANPTMGADPPPPEVTFRALDTDADGALTPAELCAFQVARFALPTATDLGGTWAFGSTGEPPEGPVFGECPPGNALQLVQAGDRVTGEEMVCGGPCSTPVALAGTYRDGALALTGVMPPPAEDAGRRIAYALRYEPRTGHLVGTRDGAPFWAAPFGRVDVENAPCPL